MLRDQHRLRRRIAHLNGLAGDELEKLSSQIEKAYTESCALVERRKQQGVKIHYPDNLPVSQQVDEIRSVLSKHQVVVIAGETGSGKTTQIPKVCLELGLSDQGLIGHTQPRRLAARTVANRIAEELNVELGNQVGYQVRFSDQSQPETLVKVMTDGILLAEIKNDPFLSKYQTIIIDEAHERSLNIDFLLGYLRNLLFKRKDLKIIITSATIDVERFSKHFGGAPIISVEGRTFPVEVKYQPATEGDDSSLPEQVEQAIQGIIQDERDKKWRIGDVLVFLPGEREIREVAKHLRHAEWRDTEITPLYARLSNEEQSRIFKGHSGRRIVLATNVAETSITVPGIRYVVDSGLARMSRYSVRSKIQRLPIEPISQASANQRKGRCGRVAEGICYRLYSEEDFVGRPEFTDPEILRTNLASVVLKMLDVGLGEVRKFPFIDMPESKLWNDGFKLLFELGAVSQNNKITKLGREIAKLPIDPKLARILYQANQAGCLNEALIVVSGLAIQDPRERPAEKRQAADQAHAVFRDVDSDFVGLLNLFNAYEEQRQELGSSALKRYAQKNFLSFMRMREWREMHRQLVLATKAWANPSHRKSVSIEPASKEVDSKTATRKTGVASSGYQNLHMAMLSGFLSNVARHDEKRDYLACRNKKIQVYPGSSLAKSKAKWIMSAELVETQQIFARVNARIEPDWIEPLAKHLVKKSWSEPHYQRKRGQVLAFEKVTLYGLEIVARRLVNYGSIDEVVAREVFIRSALVEGEYRGRVKAIRTNLQTLAELEKIEDRTRRKDVVIDEEALYGLYDQMLPSHIVSDAALDKWFRSASDEQKAAIEFKERDLKLDNAAEFDVNLFPDQLENNGIKLPLTYSFKPGTEEDGVSVSVPARAVRQVTASRIEKLVPGLLREKCIQLIKNLPRSLRKHFVPVPDTVDKIFDKVEASTEPLLETLAAQLRFMTNVSIPIEAWNVGLLDPHLRLNIKLLDDDGKVLKQSRELVDLVDVADDYLSANPVSNASSKETAVADEHVDTWNFDLEKELELAQAGITLKVYPCLIDQRTKVLKTTRNDELEAQRLTRLGFARLLFFKLRDQVALFEKEIPDYKKMGLYYAPVGKAERLYDDFAMACIVNHFGGDDLPSTAEEFEQRWKSKRGDFVAFSRDFAKLSVSILAEYHELMKRLKGKINFTVAMSVSDIKHQIENLIFDGFLSKTPYENLSHFPRYLKACSVRFEKIGREQGLERMALPLLKEWWDQYTARLEQHQAQGIYDVELERFRWLIEEQRVSWFAQQLGTSETVSEKRLNKQWQLVRRV
jgi:ATP-dependent RNA helicase HrpA